MFLNLFSFILILTLNKHFCYPFSFSTIFDSTDNNEDNNEIKDKSSLNYNNDPDRPLMCYRGLKYLIGQEEIDDNVNCVRNFLEKSARMDKFCYKFTSNSGGTEFVKRGCSVPLGVGCTKMEFEGVEGEMCCCSDTSYCNNAKKYKLNLILVFINIFVFLFTANFILNDYF